MIKISKKVSLSILIPLLFISINSFAQNKLGVGSTAPDFTGFNYKGKATSLYNELKGGPVVLVFYRGHWSAECMDFLINLQDSTEQINAKNGVVIAVTPEGKAGVEKTISKTKFKSTIIIDNQANIMKLYDTEHKADPHLVNQLKVKGTDLKALNETNGVHLPVPAVYVIGKNKKINYMYFNADYSKHPNISELMEPLEQTISSGFKKKK